MKIKKPNLAKLKTLHGSRRTLHSGLYAGALTAAVLAVVVLLNLVIRALPTQYTQYDISTGSLFTLTATTKSVLGALQSDVTAYYLAETGQEDENVTRLLDRYAGQSNHFTWQQRDPVLYPTFAQQYSGASTGSIVVTCGDNSRVIDYNDLYTFDLDAYYTDGSQSYAFSAENALTSAISQVTRTATYALYELTGHGETALGSDFTETLTNASVTAAELNLTTEGSIPADASALLLNAPQADLTAAETELLTAYLQNGGRLFVVTDFTIDTPSLDSLLASCGLTRQPGLLVETDADHYPYGYPQTYLLPAVESNEITAGMASGLMVYTPIAQGIALDEDSDYTLTALLSTGDTAYSMENYATAETAQKADTDPEGSFAVAAAAEHVETGARLVWVNCPNALLDSISESVSGGNAQFFGSCVNWLNGETASTVIDGKSMSAASLTVPTTAATALGVLFTLVLPLALVVAGIVVCLVRRRR